MSVFYLVKCDRILAVISISVAVCSIHIHYTLLQVNSLELAPNFTGIITAISNGCGNVFRMIFLVVLEAKVKDVIKYRDFYSCI